MNKRIYTAVLSIMLALPAFGQVSFGVVSAALIRL